MSETFFQIYSTDFSTELEPYFRLNINGVDLSPDRSKYINYLNIEEALGKKSQLEFSVWDPTFEHLNNPKFALQQNIVVYAGYRSDYRAKGPFEITNIEFNISESGVNLKITAEAGGKLSREVARRTINKGTLRDLFARLAADNDLVLEVDPEVDSAVDAEITDEEPVVQNGETTGAFLQRLSDHYGWYMSVNDKKVKLTSGGFDDKFAVIGLLYKAGNANVSDITVKYKKPRVNYVPLTKVRNKSTPVEETADKININLDPANLLQLAKDHPLITRVVGGVFGISDPLNTQGEADFLMRKSLDEQNARTTEMAKGPDGAQKILSFILGKATEQVAPLMANGLPSGMELSADAYSSGSPEMAEYLKESEAGAKNLEKLLAAGPTDLNGAAIPQNTLKVESYSPYMTSGDTQFPEARDSIVSSPPIGGRLFTSGDYGNPVAPWNTPDSEKVFIGSSNSAVLGWYDFGAGQSVIAPDGCYQAPKIAKQRTKKLVLEGKLEEISCTLKVGSMIFSPRQNVDLRGVGAKLDGNYRVQKVEHSWTDDQAFQTKLVLLKGYYVPPKNIPTNRPINLSGCVKPVKPTFLDIGGPASTEERNRRGGVVEQLFGQAGTKTPSSSSSIDPTKVDPGDLRVTIDPKTGVVIMRSK